MSPKSSWSSTGAIASAVLASACCLGPAIVAAVGVGTASFATALEPYRPYLLGLTGILLGGAFYLAYRRRPAACGPDGVCHMEISSRRQKLVLWTVTVLVLGIAGYPYWSGRNGDLARATVARVDSQQSFLVVELPVTGMTCDACARHVESELEKVPGVAGADASYKAGSARVALAGKVPTEQLIRAVELAGYKASWPEPTKRTEAPPEDSNASGSGGK